MDDSSIKDENMNICCEKNPESEDMDIVSDKVSNTNKKHMGEKRQIERVYCSNMGSLHIGTNRCLISGISKYTSDEICDCAFKKRLCLEKNVQLQHGIAGLQPQHHSVFSGLQPHDHPGDSGLQPQHHPRISGLQPPHHPGVSGLNAQYQLGVSGIQQQHQPKISDLQPQHQPGVSGLQAQHQPGVFGLQPQQQTGVFDLQPHHQQWEAEIQLENQTRFENFRPLVEFLNKDWYYRLG